MKAIFFDIDGTLVTHGIYNLNPILFDFLISEIKSEDVRIGLCTNRPILGHLPHLICQKEFDYVITNKKKICGLPLLGALHDWMFSQEYKNKIDRLVKLSIRDDIQQLLLVENNHLTVFKAMDAGIDTIYAPDGINEEVSNSIIRWLSRQY